MEEARVGLPQTVRFSALMCFVWICLGGASVPAAAPAPQVAKPEAAAKGGAMGFALKAQAFTEGAAIPSRLTCDGMNLSPQLAWNGVPTGTKSFVLIVDDPDAPGGTFVHWVFF